jgi:hypothetical protein
MPDPGTGLSPSDIFTRTQYALDKFHDLHVWGCPAYVLDKTIADGKKLPRWKPRSSHSMVYLGHADKYYASSVPLILNLQTGSITPQFHVVMLLQITGVPLFLLLLRNFLISILFFSSVCS